MKKNIRTSLILLVLIFLRVNIFCQSSKNDPPVVLTIDVENSKFSNDDLLAVPFDEEFVITGTKKDFTGEVRVKYKIVGFCDNYIAKNIKCKKTYKKGRHYYIFSEPKDKDGYVHIATYKTDNGTFRIDMPMLHPNENYEIVFDFINKFKLNDADTESLRLKIYDAISTTFNYNVKPVTGNDVIYLKKTIKKSIHNATNNKNLFDKDGVTKVDFDNIFKTNNELNDVRKEIATNYYDIYNVIKKVNSRIHKDRINSKIVDLLYKNKNVLINGFNDVLKQKHYKDFRESKIDLLLNNSLTIDSILKIIVKDYQRDNNWASYDLTLLPNTTIDTIPTNSYLLGILTGQIKIEDDSLKVSKKYDLNSVKLIAKLFSLIKDRKQQDGSDLFANKSVLKGIIEQLNKLIAEIKKINLYENNVGIAKAKFPNVLKDTYSKWSISSSLPTRVVVESKESPYLGLDFGYLYAPKIGSSFIFESVNFHVVPVNRKAKISQYHGWDKLLKTTSIMIGFAQRVGNYDDNFDTVTGIGSPFVGAGFKLSKLIRINGGVIFYRIKNDNPLITEKMNKNTYFLAASLDVKLKDVASFIGKLLTNQ